MKSGLIICILLVLNTASLFGRSGPDESSINNTLRKCWDTLYINPDKALSYGHEALAESQKHNYTSGIISASNLLGIVFDVRSKYDSSLFYYYQALHYSKMVNDTFSMANSTSNIGLSYWHMNDYNKSLEYFYQALSYFESLNPEGQGIANVLNNIGIIFNYLNDHENALEKFKNALDIYKKIDDKHGIGATLTNMATSYKKQNIDSLAIQKLLESIDVKEEINDYYGLCISYNELTHIYISQDKLKDAIAQVEKSFLFGRKTNSKKELIQAYHLMQDISMKKRQYQKAIRYNTIALKLAKEIKNPELTYSTYLNFSEAYEKLGRYQKALKYYQKYNKIKDSLLDANKLNNIYIWELNNKLEKKSKELSLLHAEHELQSLRIKTQSLSLKRKNLQLLIIIGAAVFAFIILMISYLSYKNRQRSKLERTLQKQREEQSKQIIQTEIKERERISEDLHDSLGQILAMIKLHLSKLHQKIRTQNIEKSSEQSQKSLELVDTAITELRAISHAMSPLLLHKKGLADSIRDISKNISNQCNCTIDVDIIDLRDNNMLTEYTIYRVVQEAFNNIIKHSKATIVELQVLQNDEEINVMIEDNGIGFKPDIQQGMGIKTMRNRVENTGGSFNIDSLEGRGTIINFSLPPTDHFSNENEGDSTS